MKIKVSDCTVSEVQGSLQVQDVVSIIEEFGTASNGEDGDEDVAGESKTVDTGAKKVKPSQETE